MSDKNELLTMINSYRTKSKFSKDAKLNLFVFHKNIFELNKDYINAMMFVFRSYPDELQKLFLALWNSSKFFTEFFDIENIITTNSEEILDNNCFYYFSSKNKVYNFIFRVIKICNNKGILVDKYEKKLFDLSVKNNIIGSKSILKYLLKNKNLLESPVNCYYTIYNTEYSAFTIVDHDGIYLYDHQYDHTYLSSTTRKQSVSFLLW